MLSSIGHSGDEDVVILTRRYLLTADVVVGSNASLYGKRRKRCVDIRVS